MRRLSNNRDLFEAVAGEIITVTVQARKTPYEVTFSDLESGGHWTVVQDPTSEVPVEKRQFTMPASSREFFAIVYTFPPSGTEDLEAEYLVRFNGRNGSSDGPKSIRPPASGDIVDLTYEFRLPNAPLEHFLPGNLAEAVRGKAGDR